MESEGSDELLRPPSVCLAKPPDLFSDSWCVTQLKAENSVWAAVWAAQIAVMLVMKENYHWRREFCMKKVFDWKASGE